MLAAMNPLPILTALALSLCLAQAALPSLKVSDNKRFLVTADGKPFFYLGDTTWELFHRLNREEAIKFLDNRTAKKFNVLQSVAIAELEGPGRPARCRTVAARGRRRLLPARAVRAPRYGPRAQLVNDIDLRQGRDDEE